MKLSETDLAQAAELAQLLGVTIPELEKCKEFLYELMLNEDGNESDHVLRIQKSDLSPIMKLWCAYKLATMLHGMPEVVSLFRLLKKK